MNTTEHQLSSVPYHPVVGAPTVHIVVGHDVVQTQPRRRDQAWSGQWGMHDLFDGGTAVSQNQARNHDIDARLCGAVAVVGGWLSMQGCLQGFVGKVRQWAHGYGCGISENVE